MSTHSENELLKKSNLLLHFTDEEIASVRNEIFIKKYSKNEIILKNKKVNEKIYLLLKGKVKIEIYNSFFKNFVIAHREAGELMGEISIIEEKKATATVTVLEDSIVGIMSKESFWNILFTQKKAVKNILKTLCLRLRDSTELIERFTHNKADDRLKMFFLKWADKQGRKTATGTQLDLQFTHQDIADMTGLLRETVSVTISKWKKKGELHVLSSKKFLFSETFFDSPKN